MSPCVRRSRHSFPDTTFASRECFLNMRCCPNRQPKSAPEQDQITRKLATSKLANWTLCVCHVATLFLIMFIKSIWIAFIGVTLFVASAWAASSVLQGIVKDAKGHPVQGADIRIEATNTGRLLTT